MIDVAVLMAGVRKDMRTALRYPLGLANVVILSPFYGLILPTLLFGSAFLVGGRAVGLEASVGTANLAGFVFAPSAIAEPGVATRFWSPAFTPAGLIPGITSAALG